MIPRYQRILFWSLFACIALMMLFLLRGCEQAHSRMTGHGDSAPLAIAVPMEAATVTLSMASDADASITPTQRVVSLPDEPTLRARTLLESLVAQYALPGSLHPLESGHAIDDVFVIDGTVHPGSADSRFSASRSGQVAVINLHGAFADHHPSGVLVETMTLQSMVGTLHSVLPQIEQVRFLVDGKPRETLAGHASLLRAYPAVESGNRPLIPLSEQR